MYEKYRQIPNIFDTFSENMVATPTIGLLYLYAPFCNFSYSMRAFIYHYTTREGTKKQQEIITIAAYLWMKNLLKPQSSLSPQQTTNDRRSRTKTPKWRAKIATK